MSIATEIQRLQNAKASIKTSIENKGVVVSSSDTLDDYSAYIDAINISTQEKTITPQNQTHEITADSGYRGLSKVILDGVLVDAHDSYTTSTDSTTAYTKTVPSGALKYANLDKLGGMSYKSENLLVLSDKEETTATIGIKYKIENGVITINGTSTSAGNVVFLRNLNCTLIAGSYTLNVFNTTFDFGTYGGGIFIGTGDWDTTIAYTSNTGIVSKNISSTTTLTTIRLYVENGVTFNNVQFKPMLVKGSTAPTYFQPYFEGIRDSAVTSVVSKDSNDTTIETYNIPAEVQALNGYGWGLSNSVNNGFSYETKKNTQKVKKYVLNGSENWQDRPNFNDCDRFVLNIDNELKSGGEGLCDKFIYSATINSTIGYLCSNQGGQLIINFSAKGTTTLAQFKTWLSNNNVILIGELANYIETDISQYINDNFIEVESGGSITANNTYSQAVPSEITYLVEV